MVEVCWILLFIVYWLQAEKSYAPQAGSGTYSHKDWSAERFTVNPENGCRMLARGERAYVSAGIHMAHLSLNFIET